MVSLSSERVPPRQPGPNAAHQPRVSRRVKARIESGDRPQAGRRPEVRRIQSADDAKSRLLRTRAHDNRKDLVAGYVGTWRTVDVDVQIVEPVLGIDEV